MVGKKRLSDDEVESVVQTLFKHKDEIYHKTSRTILGKSSVIWKNLSSELKGLKTSIALYTMVVKNYHNLWSTLGINEENSESESTTIEEYPNKNSETILLDLKKSSESENGSESDSSNCEGCENVSEDQVNFTITLTAEEYVQMRPEERLYSCGDKWKVSTHRAYTAFMPGTWSHIIFAHFSEHTRDLLSCSVSFKRARIMQAGNCYARIEGSCKECRSKFIGIIEREPECTSRAHVKCTYIGNYKKDHVMEKKRPLSGLVRKQAVDKMVKQNISATMVRKLQAHECMRFLDDEPKNLPSGNVLRVAKHSALMSQRLNVDPFNAIFQMMNIRPFDDDIRSLSLVKFHVHYWSPAQIHVYKSYVRSHPNNSKLSIDATGGVVKKLQRSSKDMKSGHIFLYEATVRETETKQQYAVTQMLSDGHTSSHILFWLSSWLRTVGSGPVEVVTDMSLALLNAVAMAFSNSSSLTDYLNKCAKVIFYPDDETDELPSCYLRCDVAHVVKLIVSWPSLQKLTKTIKHLYVRSMCQAIQCFNKNELHKILCAVFVVSLSKTEGDRVSSEGETICAGCKRYLKGLVSVGIDNASIEDALLNISSEQEESHQSSETHTEKSPFIEWVTEIADACRNRVSLDDDGEVGNRAVAPKLIEDVLKMARLIPLWTGIMREHFKVGELIATSAPVESNFQDLKNRVFKHCTLPLRVDDFLDIHIRSLDGTMKLGQAGHLRQASIISFFINLFDNRYNSFTAAAVITTRATFDSTDTNQSSQAPQRDEESVRNYYVKELDGDVSEIHDAVLDQNGEESNQSNQPVEVDRIWHDELPEPTS